MLKERKFWMGAAAATLAMTGIIAVDAQRERQRERSEREAVATLARTISASGADWDGYFERQQQLAQTYQRMLETIRKLESDLPSR
jgi:uncharacterized membrane protein YccC